MVKCSFKTSISSCMFAPHQQAANSCRKQTNIYKTHGTKKIQKISCQKLRRSNSVHLQHENRPMGWHVAMCIYSALSREPLNKSNVWQESAPIPKYGCAAHFHLSSSRSTPVIVFLMASPSHRLQDWVARVCSD